MNLNKKLPAFTLMEVTISMLIAAIAIAITFTAYRIVSGSYKGFIKKQNSIATLIVTDKLFKQDFINAKSIVRSVEGLVLETDKGMISYSFKNGYILRNQFSLQTDTFKLQINNLRFVFEGEDGEEGKPIDQLSFQTLVNGDRVSLQYQKMYSAQNLFQ